MLDIIGTLYDIDSIDPDNPVSAPLDGYHVNATRKIKGADAYLIEPETPRRVFAGAVTYCYTFANEAEAKQIIGYDDEAGYTPEFEPKPVPVPATITARQARLVLAKNGLLSEVERAIGDIEDTEARQVAGIEWEYAAYLERHAPWLTHMAAQLGMSDADVDAMFIQGETL
ncbi:hypothetical protein CUU95_18480 [Vreelandella alkaliphila]|uniref:hypothetical protein n=1 Tax=Vreelandella alkaliphila TaxID=272774 RepID=UPI000EA2CDF4|nr:hypothetical protein [Halomonas alkaliphila]AYF35619.1 hypothetical protein CUU95_18160 [Halomonas alkaliphila]AYF35678.1 hypothetical protein CUU95_18480 [Halomonas alkaliphila]